jgi:choline transport protein
MWGSRILDRISKGLLIFNIVAFIVTIATILACNKNKQSASFVFKDFQNFTGFGTSMAGIIGILQPAFGMCCCKYPHLIFAWRNRNTDVVQMMHLHTCARS